ncbi:glycerophosphodiester phosphodiesterase family protein [Stenotrophomonas ginsengisoli]|nr:glycerophosphodiester phosphodiesterase family protein [Stenotrophomonas ginsengisoli]
MAQVVPDARIYAHRGASALLPEHTLAAYAQAIADGAHYIELDLVPSKDGVLVVRHENELSGTTDVAEHRQFRDRRTTKQIDGQPVEGWFSEDFSWAELQQLRARERLPELRGTTFDGQFRIARLEEVIALVVSQAARSGRGIGLAPELKHPAYFRGLGLPLEERVLEVLGADSYTRVAPLVIQSFEADSLRRLRLQVPKGGNIALLQLVGPDQAGLLDDAGLAAMATYADVLGPDREHVIARQADGRLSSPGDLVQRAHRVGLQVVPWTFRPEQPYLPAGLPRSGEGLRQEAAAVAEMQAYLATGIDGLMTDDPALGVRALQAGQPD